MRCASVLITTAYVSLFAQAGAAARIFIGELFAGNCTRRDPEGSLSWIPCVASSGVDESYGGALFKDLPANMLGCFVIGILTSTGALNSLFPSLNAPELPMAAVAPHRELVQKNSSLQLGLRTGFCGSLTTFASWKLQMVQMLVAGTGAYYHSQWLGVGLALILGTMAALASLVVGQHVALGLLKWRETRSNKNKLNEEAETSEGKSQTLMAILVALTCILVSAGALFGVVASDGTGFWRRFYASVLLAPFGAVARWQLSSLNGTLPWSWFPAGTFAANMLACILSFVSQGIDTTMTGIKTEYQLLLFALRTGLAGSLSTVSTWVVEIQKLMSKSETLHRGYFYAVIGQAAAISLGIAIYGTFIWA